MKTNVKQKSPPIFTHEGAVAAHINPYQQLRRSVLACLLFETEFYEDGQEIAKRIIDTAALCTPEQVAALAVAARRSFGLRHAPLLLLLDLIKRGGKLAGDTIANTVKRADDLTELVALYWKFNPGKPLTKQMKIGLGRALLRFDAYGLAKYNRDGAVKLRDILFLTHAKPEGEAQEVLFKQLAENALPIPDTWETELSAGKDKRETFTRLLNEGKLGYLALLRNLRNMTEAGVDTGLIKAAILARKGADLVFPFRYTAAARIVPQLERELDQALIAEVEGASRPQELPADVRFAEMSRLLLQRAGGGLSLTEAAKLLGTSRQALHKRVKAVSALGLMDGAELVLPKFQFVEEGKRPSIIEGLAKVIKPFDSSKAGRWSALQFLLEQDPNLAIAPIEALKAGDVQKVVDAAAAYLDADD